MEYRVRLGEHAKRYYIKRFEKKYKGAWNTTYNSLHDLLVRLDGLILTDKAETMTDAGDLKLVKVSFPVHGTKKSAKDSGCRAIIVADTAKGRVDILLVYHKSDLTGSGSETVKWKALVRKKYPTYNEIIGI